MKFTKMQGIGNDYVYVDCLHEQLEHPSEISKVISDRHFGIGADGLILIRPSDEADFMMDMYNADGSRGRMCGNGIRCVGKYVYDNGLTTKEHIAIETLSGIKQLDLETEGGSVSRVRVNMGAPILNPADIPVDIEGTSVIDYPVIIKGDEYRITCVSMGNPHAVVFVDDTTTLELKYIGPSFENYLLFPNKINTEFIKVDDRGHITMRVWERGSGETMACGTGACAAVTAAVINGYTDRRVTVKLLGGELLIEWNAEDNCIYMTGAAVTVFKGEIDMNSILCGLK